MRSKTADGVPVIPGTQKVYFQGEESIRIAFAAYHWLTGSDEKRWWAEFRGGKFRLVEICFSSLNEQEKKI